MRESEILRTIAESKNDTTFIFRSGVYYFNSALDVNGKTNVAFVCEYRGKAQLINREMADFVMDIRNCADIRVEGLSMRHLERPDQMDCSAAVIHCESTVGFIVRKCELNGCGSAGVSLDYCRNVMLLDSVIHHNSYWGIYAEATTDLLIRGNTIASNPQAVYLLNYKNVSIRNNRFLDNERNVKATVWNKDTYLTVNFDKNYDTIRLGVEMTKNRFGNTDK